MVICLERGANLHMAHLMPLPLTISCFSKIQIDFTFLVPAHPVVPEKGPLNGCVCVMVLKGKVKGRDVNSREIAFLGRESQFPGLGRDSRFRPSTYLLLA